MNYHRHILYTNLLVCLCVPESHYFNLNLVPIMKSFEGRLTLQNKKWLNKQRGIWQKGVGSKRKNVAETSVFCRLFQNTNTKKTSRRFNYRVRCKDILHYRTSCFRNVSLGHKPLKPLHIPRTNPWNIYLGHIPGTHPWDTSLQHNPGTYPRVNYLGCIPPNNPGTYHSDICLQHIPGISLQHILGTYRNNIFLGHIPETSLSVLSNLHFIFSPPWLHHKHVWHALFREISHRISSRSSESLWLI